MNSILITGCNRGLGLGLVKSLIQLRDSPKYIIATCRNLEQAEELVKLKEDNPNLHIVEIDLRSYKEYDNLTKKVSEIIGDEGLNVLFNNAGVSPKSSRITATRENELLDTLQTNAVVPIMLTKAFIPLLRKASEHYKNDDLSVKRAAIINMSSILGSIASNADGGLYAYRSSKAALNAATKSMSIDLYPHKILCVSLHPGWVRTDMGGPKAPLDVETSTNTILQTILNFDKTHNGGFYQFDGAELPW